MAAPKLRFKEFDGDWSSIAIGNLLKIKSGLGFKAEEYTTEEAIRLLQIENVGYGAVKWTHNVKYVPHDYLSIHSELVLKEDDIVLALNRPVTNDQLKIAKLTKDDGPSILYQRVGKLEFTKNEIDHNFIFQIFQKEVKSYVLNSSIGSDQPFISTTDLYKHKITLPAQKEQTKIASFLCAVDEKISQLTQKHELLSQYKQGMMQKLFSQQIRFKADDGSEFGEWEDSKLGELTILITKGTTPSSLGEKYEESGINFIKIESLSSNGKFLLDKFAYIDENTHNKLARSKLEHDDILFSIAGALGRVAIISRDYLPANTNQALAIIRLKDKKITRYIYYFLNSDYVKKIIDSESVQLAQANFSLGQLANLDVLVPCLEEQTKIANFLSAIDQKIEVVAQQIEQAKHWKKGLLQQMFV